MMKRMLAIVLALVMMLGILPVMALEEDITVYLSVSQNGEIIDGKDGKEMAYRPVVLTGKDSYCLDDVFLEAHITYYQDGTEGYQSSFNEQYQSLSVTKMWGDTSFKFGYQVNGGSESVMGAQHVVEDGDLVDIALYQSAWPNTEAYATFDIAKKELTSGDEITLTLNMVSGYDQEGNQLFSPCEGAAITVSGIDTEIITDANGQATVTLDEIGNFIISAKKSKTIDITDEENNVVDTQIVPAITAPVCVVSVKERPEIKMIHHIAAQYATIDLASTDGNLPWIIADMMTYESLYPDSDFCFTKEKKQEAVLQLIENGENATSPGDLAKTILALRALGYDAKKVYTENFTKIDFVEKLITLVDEESPDVTNVFTLPYVMIALSQSEDYATREQLKWLIDVAISSKSSWQALEMNGYYVGTDGMTPMLLALAPYYNETNPDVKNAVDEALVILREEQREDGLIDGFEGYEAASTGLAICAFSALNMDAETIKKGKKSLIDGLISTADESLTIFPNAFATEQGFRGLLAWQLLLKNPGDRIYDFVDCGKQELNLSGVENCPVCFTVTPASATVLITGKKEVKTNCFDLPAGTYSYTVSASGYQQTTGTVVVSETDALGRIAKTITLSLSSNDSGFSGGFTGGGSYQEKPTIQKPEQEQETEETLTEETFSDVKKEDWFYPAVAFVYDNGLFQGTEHGFEPESFMTRAMLVTVLHRFAKAETIEEKNPFLDVPENEWYSESVAWAANHHIINGVSETAFDPDGNITREQIALILYRYAMLYGYDVTNDEEVHLSSYLDAGDVADYAVDAIKYAIASGVMNGKTAETLAPGENATRAEVATMLMRFAGIK